MDSHKPTQPPEQLLDDLESIHDLLCERNEPPLLTESFEPDNIPLLSDVVSPGTAPRAPEPQAAAPATTGLAPAEQERLDDELRASAELILQEVIDDFAPQIEAELRRRLQARLDRLLGQRNG
ncbi:DNA polymerase III subunit chi [Pseudomonas aeruginosa]|uniref:DNA polymerase III subunit chi n=1 Tax=Pseudomonas aeruginosa TaxID=287 RepID=UPI002359473D|nr:DNA polymerase III subunit chi [Pseudomonas aeruginosa]